jgi:hypothetical protein
MLFKGSKINGMLEYQIAIAFTIKILGALSVRDDRKKEILI